MVRRILPLLVLPVLVMLCTSYVGTDKRSKVLIHTDFGDIKIVLYDETPKHRDNFLKLINNRALDSTLFHRVIKQFMIQGGDPDSKKAKPKQLLGNGNVGYTLPSEIHPNLFHKRGALCAARLGDDVNPNHESSGCQFYIVEGSVYTDSSLDMLIKQRMEGPIKQKIFDGIINKPENAGLKSAYIRAQQRAMTTRNPDSLNYYAAIVNPMVEAEFTATPHRTITPEQRKVYTTFGGTPFLDGAYTVFGEVIEGMEVVDVIGSQPKDKNDRPVSDVRMTVKVIK
ncbi:MAG TPA: peptidylprolyl isomerase [Bacteroidia bacterium]|nr:peptidylprolyl isomerase [Bacteroidia bacterium]